MSRTFRIGIVVAAAFAFSVACMMVGGSTYTEDTAVQICGFLMWPGVAITDRGLGANLIANPLAFAGLSVAVNTLIYSVLLAVFVEIVIRIIGRSELQN